MEDAFFKTADRSFGFRFHGNPLDRASDRREDAAFLAELRARPDARTLLIARDMPILVKGEPREAFFPRAASRRSAGRRLEILLGLSLPARRFSPRCCRTKRSSSAPTTATAFSTGASSSCPAARISN